MVQNTALALLPVLTVLLVSVLTKRALLGLLAGTVVGAVLLGGWGFFDTLVGTFGASLTNETVHWLVLVVVLFGILIAYFNASGAVNDFARWTERFVNSRRKSLLLTWLLTVALFIDDYLNALTVGTSMKRVTDRYNVPRTMVGSIVKLTSAPIAVIIPFSTWAVFFSALLEQDGVTVNGSGFGAYLSGLPYVFFGWFALAIGLLLALGLLPLVGPLKRAQELADRTGDPLPEGLSPEERAFELAEDGKDSTRPLPFNFLIPIVVLVLVTILTEVDIVKGAAAAVVVAIILYVAQRRLTLKGVLDHAFEGITSMGYVMVLFVLAFMVQQINMDLQLADWVIGATEPVMSGALLPAIVFLVCGVYAYATGAFWDLAAVITPVVLPLAIAVGVDPVLAGTAVFSGAALGSTTCLYGDGIILASKSVGVKPLNLMLSILPYAGLAAALSFIAYLIAGYVSFNA
ncbi:TRAP transporter large permease subunit [Leucobacter luti]|uniref:Transporter (NhaC family) n=1 Tax=Leucobacter luti TaxID=340320 RepID=A0A4R6RQX0_9MICO|nr:TRAP transporter large permease subunit [Leucobacter luti]MCW2289485.1 Na+/H+ antiporter NhaC [Leucobacter luti]QYM74754.1 TRAP transporter large permease subunit [Leucobacter luti]TCK33904.1 transporter (NhaC family) [Leucobacter luti]TDP89130.1 transporter (NhaC family) [Leucobacter luti]